MNSPCSDKTDVSFYKTEIDLLEAEIAVEDLIAEVFGSIKYYKLTTDSWEIVDELCRKEVVILIKHKWSWRFFRIMYYVEYIPKKRGKCYS